MGIENSDKMRFPPRCRTACLIACLLSFVVVTACNWNKPRSYRFADADLTHYVETSTHIQFPDLTPAGEDHFVELASTTRPFTLVDQGPIVFRDMTLQEAVQLALFNSQVLRDLGGAVLQAPDSVATTQTPALQESDPRFGVEGALSAFDAMWSTSAFVAKNDRALNNEFLGGGTRLLQQDLFNYSSELSKRSAVGTLLSARHNVEYDFNNAPGNDTPNKPWMTNLELEVRQPLLQGGGVDFNRIAGPGARPGIYNGVLIARINTDITLTDFEAGVRDLVNDVETAYWELYFAYRDLDAKIAARDQALNLWRLVQSLETSGRRGGSPEKESRAREQYFRLEAETQNALTGRLQERSRATTFRGVGGIHHNERRLRLMVGLPIGDGSLLRPTTEPTMANVRYAWEDVLIESLTRRVELRKQQWKIKRRELELLAAKNHLLPQLDVLGRYRWRGLGEDLLEPNGTGRPPFHDAFQNLFDGNFQEWQLGAEFSLPVGFRQASAAVRNAQLNLHRDRAVWEEQQREVTLEISQAIGEKDRAYVLSQIALNRRLAAKDQVDATAAMFAGAEVSQQAYVLDLLLDAQRRLADADTEYFRSLAEYMMAIKAVHYAKGSLLDYNEVYLTEGPWPDKAYADAWDRQRRRIHTPILDNYILRSPRVSSGVFPQQFSSGEQFLDATEVTPEHLNTPTPRVDLDLPEPTSLVPDVIQ